MEPNGVLWIVAMIVFIVMECVSYQLISIWMAIGAFAALICHLVGFEFFTQFTVFLVLSIILVFLTRPFSKKFLEGKTEKTNVDRVIGEKAIVTEAISNIENCGRVKINGMEWSARTENDIKLEVGEIVEVVKIEGVRVIVKKED